MFRVAMSHRTMTSHGLIRGGIQQGRGTPPPPSVGLADIETSLETVLLASECRRDPTVDRAPDVDAGNEL